MCVFLCVKKYIYTYKHFGCKEHTMDIFIITLQNLGKQSNSCYSGMRVLEILLVTVSLQNTLTFKVHVGEQMLK